MSNYIVMPNQSMPDVVIQATGSMEAAMQFCLDNSVSISDTPTVGSSMVVSEAALALGDTLVKQYLRKNSIVVGTLNAEYVALPHPGVYSRTITINHTLCGGSDSSNFPVLISITDPSLKTIANGGHVHNSNGYDISWNYKAKLGNRRIRQLRRHTDSLGKSSDREPQHQYYILYAIW